MTLQALIDQAWTDHADQSEAVATRFPPWVEAAVAAPALPDEVPALARLIAHVCGEHLARWHGGVQLIQCLDKRAVALGDARHRSVLARHVAALRIGAGEDGAGAALALPEQVAALAQASVALTGQAAWPRAIALYRQALGLAGNTWGSARGAGEEGAAGVRALAIGGNNLANALEERSDLDLHET
jgi:hypothetical protein